MPNNPAAMVQHWNSEVAASPQISKRLVCGKQLNQSIVVMTNFTLNDLQAWRSFNIEFKRFAEAIAFPKCQRLCVFPVVACRDERISNWQGCRHVLHERRKEIVSGRRRCTYNDGPKGLLRQMAI